MSEINKMSIESDRQTMSPGVAAGGALGVAHNHFNSK